MKRLIYIIRHNMAANIIGAVIVLLAVFGVIASVAGLVSFTRAFKKEYDTTTYHMADTATSLVNGNNVEEYLEGRESEEFLRTKDALDTYCKKINVSLIYVIKVDESDYRSFLSVFNSVNNSVGNTTYTPWVIGYERATANEEYRQKYQALYEKKTPFETVYRTRPTDGSPPHITTLVPVKNTAGKVVSLLCIQRPIRELNEARRPYLLQIGVSMLVLQLLSAVTYTIFIRKKFVEPILKVSGEASRFARENTKGKELGKLSRFDELQDLAHSIDTMETDMVNYVENLTAITAEKERIGAELSFASTIQENALPNVFPPYPDRTEFDIYATMTPAKEVGGDFYNFFLIDDDHLALMIGDVSGKGVPAALFMMVSNIITSSRASLGGTPADTLAYVNTKICDNNRSDMFVTLWVGILEISTGKVIAANAGHEDAAVYRKDGSFELFKTRHGLAVGAMPDMHYRDFEISLEPGDKLFLYTDGVPEATDRDNNMFGNDRMMDALNAYKDKTPEEILAGVHRCVNEFVGDMPQFDDLTMLCVELKEKS